MDASLLLDNLTVFEIVILLAILDLRRRVVRLEKVINNGNQDVLEEPIDEIAGDL